MAGKLEKGAAVWTETPIGRGLTFDGKPTSFFDAGKAVKFETKDAFSRTAAGSIRATEQRFLDERDG